MIDVIYAESNTEHQPGFVYEQYAPHDWWLLIQTHCKAFFEINGETIIIPPHAAILYPPDSTFRYGAVEDENYSDDWVRFLTDENFIINGSIPLNTPFNTLENLYISELFLLIAGESFYTNKYKELSIQFLFRVLFNKLKESLSTESGNLLENSLMQLRLNIQANPGAPWNVTQMAKFLYISPRHLQKLYQKQFGLSCMSDVINNRIEFAKNLLKDTNMSIIQISIQCGYSSAEHFSRQFKKHTGLSPKKYREANK